MAWEQSHLESKWALRRMMLPVTSRHLNPDTPVIDDVRLLSGQKGCNDNSVISYFLRHTELSA